MRPLVFNGHPVPYSSAWTAEIVPVPRVIADAHGLAMPGHDRDERGVLWRPFALRQRLGRPEYGTVHGPRQRRCMRRMLCQVCGGPADRTEQGWLWLLEDHRGEPGWPEGEVTTHPPVCRPCALLAARMCPHLQRGVVAVRAARPLIDTVYGQLYKPGWPAPLPGERGVFLVRDPVVRWVLGGQLAVSLMDVTLVDLPELSESTPLPEESHGAGAPVVGGKGTPR